MKKTWIALIILLCGICWNVSAQRRGGELEANIDTSFVTGKQWAVFIAVDEYREWTPLLYPVKDAQEIKNILLEHYYIDEIRECYNKNATAASIRRLFIELQEKTGPNDSVFVFHAGHGFNDDKTRTSAWIPYDAGENRLEQANWLSHLQIRSMLDALKAKHVFLISDSCYSGDLLDTTRGSIQDITNYPAAYNRVSRLAMSSGASEEVEDVSEFASRLRSTLLRTETAYITPDYLLSQIKGAQTSRPLYTIPILAAIPRSSHQLGGSIVFFRKNAKPTDIVQRSSSQQPIDPVVTQNPQPKQAEPGENAFFVGKWISTVEHNNSYDTYEITLNANGRCTVKVTNDDAEQETTGNWSWNGTTFKLDAVFRNARITYLRNIQWTSIVSYSGNNAFNIIARAETNGSPVRFTFYRE